MKKKIKKYVKKKKEKCFSPGCPLWSDGCIEGRIRYNSKYCPPIDEQEVGCK